MKDRHQCECSTTKWMAFECVACCVRWLSQMTREEIAINAPVIEYVMGADHMEKVREAWKGMRDAEKTKNQAAERNLGVRH